MSRLDMLFFTLLVSWCGTLIPLSRPVASLHPAMAARVFDHVHEMYRHHYGRREGVRRYRAIGNAPLGYRNPEVSTEYDTEVDHAESVREPSDRLGLPFAKGFRDFRKDSIDRAASTKAALAVPEDESGL